MRAFGTWVVAGFHTGDRPRNQTGVGMETAAHLGGIS
jgi:hypothetical protein